MPSMRPAWGVGSLQEVVQEIQEEVQERQDTLEFENAVPDGAQKEVPLALLPPAPQRT